jgi:hypothetical protein
METGALYFLLAVIGAGSVSLGSYLIFLRGGDRRSQRGVAWFAIKAGMRHLPMMLLVGAAFWYSIVLTVLAAYLPEGALQTVGVAAGFVLILTTVVLMLVWAYRPPRRLLPRWYLAELDQAPQPGGSKRHRVVTALMIWVAVIFLVGAYAAYRLDAPWYLWAVTAVIGAALFAGYVVRD